MPTAPFTNPPLAEEARTTQLTWRSAALVTGDALAFLIFAGVGRTSHHEASGLRALGEVAATAVPFALGWFAVGPWLGAFRRGLTVGVKPMLRTTERAWLFAWPVACVMRFALAPDHSVPVSFAVVILLANAVFLGGWRGVFAWATRRVRW